MYYVIYVINNFNHFIIICFKLCYCNLRRRTGDKCIIYCLTAITKHVKYVGEMIHAMSANTVY